MMTGKPKIREEIANLGDEIKNKNEATAMEESFNSSYVSQS